MLCFRNVNQIAILERETKSILWVWGEGELQWPHHPTMLDDGNILIFDNGVGREYSQVIEVDPTTGQIVWRYVGNPPQAFYSFSKGSPQRLPNGNTLICDSDNGRALEVTAEGETVWEWYNPAKTEDGKRIVVYRMTRLSPESVEPLLYE
jgi:outer membrane protein assembly factor BamB